MDFQQLLIAVKDILPPQSTSERTQVAAVPLFSSESDQLATGLFQTWFLDKEVNSSRDDLLFFVRKSTEKGESKIDVARKDSTTLPSVSDKKYMWSETLLLNLILHEFEYQVTVAVCTVHRSITVIAKKSMQLFPSPTKQRMDKKSKESETIYPNIFFGIDNFEESFKDIVVQHEGEKVAVELLALNPTASIKKLIFSGMVDYTAVHKAFVVREKSQSSTSFSSRLANITPFKSRIQSYNVEQLTQYIRLRGPRKSGFAEVAVRKHQTVQDSSLPSYNSADNASGNISTVSFVRKDSPLSGEMTAASHRISMDSTPVSEVTSRKISSDDIAKKPLDSMLLNASLTYIMLHWRTILEAVLYGESSGKLS